MAPFIKFTEKTGASDQREIFINAEHILTAIYLQQTGDLQISLIGSGGHVAHILHGQDAADALTVLGKLKG